MLKQYRDKLIRTIIKDQGATLTQDLQPADLKAGYMISLKGHEIQTKAISFEALDSFRRKTPQSAYVGVWYDVKSGLYYIDASIHMKDLSEALQIASKNNQLAIYDLSKGVTTYL